MPAYGNMFGGPQPANNSLWVGNNYSTSGYPQNNRMNYLNSMMNNQNAGMPNNNLTVQSINNIFQVMGPESAQAYQVGPNSRVILMESGRPIFYIKQSDDSGYSQVRAFKFSEIPFDSLITPNIETQQSETQTTEYATKSDLEEFKKMIEDLVMKNE